MSASPSSAGRSGWWLLAAGLAVALGLAFFVSPHASSQPDGLSKVAIDEGFAEQESDHALAETPTAGYGVEGVDDDGLSTGLAGLLGVVLTFGLMVGLVYLVRSGKDHEHPRPARGGQRNVIRAVAASSPIHRLPAHVKIVAVLVFVIGVVATLYTAVVAFAVDAIAVIIVAAIAGMAPWTLARRLVIELPFVAFALLLPFVARGPNVEVLGLSLSENGLWSAWNILAKGTLGVAASVILAATTPVGDLLTGADRLRIPKAFTAIAGFMVRYGEVMVGELDRLRIARISRGDNPRWIWQAWAVATTAGALFVRSFERGERVHLAMVSRGFTGTWPQTVALPAAAPTTWFAALSVSAVAATGAITAWTMS